MPKNKYVDFVSDEHFLRCVKWVCDAYPDKSADVNMEMLQRNALDPFKMVFDIVNGKTEVETWVKNEAIRQFDKTINNRIGEFHQKLLGGVNGWTNLGTGDESKVDLKRKDNSIFMELKNKFNTVNADSLQSVRQKLERCVIKNPKAMAYWAYIVERDGSSGESPWSYRGENNPRIRKIWGGKVYELVTGDTMSFGKTWRTLPAAINDVIGKRNAISEENIRKLVKFFEDSFRNYDM